LALGPDGFPGWSPYPVHDDGVLVWVRLDHVGGEEPLEAPIVPERPERAIRIAAVESMAGRCEPEDVVANRLDPWHGSWFHPYSFVGLKVTEVPEGPAPEQDRLVVDVGFKVAGRWGVPVRAEFTCPEPRTVVMRIIEGEGRGSVVETHATPLGVDERGVPRTAVIEAIVASSERVGFAPARRAARLVRPVMRMAARRLWRDDLAYAERGYLLRSGGRGGRPARARARKSAFRPRRGTLHRVCPCRPHRGSSALAANSPLVAAPSMSATGRSTRTWSPATTRVGSGVVTVHRSVYPPGGNNAQSMPSSCRASTTRAPAISGYT